MRVYYTVYVLYLSNLRPGMEQIIFISQFQFPLTLPVSLFIISRHICLCHTQEKQKKKNHSRPGKNHPQEGFLLVTENILRRNKFYYYYYFILFVYFRKLFWGFPEKPHC